MKISKYITKFVTLVLLVSTLTVPAAATDGFTDVDDSSPWYDGIMYAAEEGITLGTGNGCFSPEKPITLRQWAVMICRAYDKQVEQKEDEPFDLACVRRGFEDGWLSLDAFLEPNTLVSRGSLMESAFEAANIELYSYELYEGGDTIPDVMNCVRVGAENGLCAVDASIAETVSRGEAVQLLYQLATSEIRVEEPPILKELDIRNTDGMSLDPYLLEIVQVPTPILHEFDKRNWSFHLDTDYLADLSDQLGISCIGAASFGPNRIYVAEPSATIHEFGHFLHSVIGFPNEFDELYRKEAQAVIPLMRKYSAKNEHEYFADYFRYWIENGKQEEKMKSLREATPQTFEYFVQLEADGWIS